jgi:hypothetical protein
VCCCPPPPAPPPPPPDTPPSAGADRAQERTIADTKRPIPIPTEQEAVAPEAFPNPSEVRGSHTVTQAVPPALLTMFSTCSTLQPQLL